MANLLHLCETMTTRWVGEDEIHVPLEVFEEFAIRNNFEIRKRSRNEHYKYSLTRKCVPVHFISGKEDNLFNFLDISDLHIGHPNFDEVKLRAVLSRAVVEQVEHVFIAGDIFEGIPDYIAGELPYSSQIDLARSIFRDYNLRYYAINGNHDYTFEQIGLQNPIKRLESALEADGIEFHYFDTYVMDFIISGVVKRLMHVERTDFNKRNIFAALKLKQFESENLLFNSYQGENYFLRFFQVGHIHVNAQLYIARKRIFISLPGSFVATDKMDDRANFVKGEIFGKKVLLY